MWSEGDTLVVRYRDPGEKLGGARPVRVVGKRNGYLATWLPAGTEVAMPVLADGRPLRDVPLVDRFRLGRSTSLQPWAGPGILMLFPDAAAHSIWLFWSDDASFRGWYVNLERRHVWHERGCDTRDHILDLWCERPREWEWKDEDELADAVASDIVSPSDADEIRAEGERIARRIEQWLPPFSDGWEQWQPNPDWPLPALPDDWAAWNHA